MVKGMLDTTIMMDYFCSAYYEGEPVQICCEDCRRVRCPYIAKFEFASPEGGSVEENSKNYGANCISSVSPTPPDGPCSVHPCVCVARQSDYL